jgi:chromosome partitioning protein
MVCEYYALEGLSDLVTTLRKVRAAVNPRIEIMGLLRTMFDARSNLSQQVSEQLASHFGSKVFETVIPRNVRLAEAPSHGLPGLVYDRNARGAQAYLALAQELTARLESATATPSV